jgi:hypothetical protein
VVREECIYVITPKLTKSPDGVLQYDFEKTIKDGKFIQTGSLDNPPTVLMTGVSKLRARHLRKGNAIRGHVDSMLESNPAMQQNFKHRNPEDDQLFQADYDHMDGEKDCKNCNEERLVQRKSRTPNVPVVHYGLIASANRVMKHGVTREKLRQERGILCFEMEAAGLMGYFPCLVIRGICDYSDTHKNKDWQPYAAATAAAYAKQLLAVITPAQVDKTPAAANYIEAVKKLNVSLLHFPAYERGAEETIYRKSCWKCSAGLLVHEQREMDHVPRSSCRMAQKLERLRSSGREAQGEKPEVPWKRKLCIIQTCSKPR